MAADDKLSIVLIEEQVKDSDGAAVVAAMDAMAWVAVPLDAPSVAAIHTVEGTHAGAATEEEMGGREGNAILSLGPSIHRPKLPGRVAVRRLPAGAVCQFKCCSCSDAGRAGNFCLPVSMWCVSIFCFCRDLN